MFRCLEEMEQVQGDRGPERAEARGEEAAEAAEAVVVDSGPVQAATASAPTAARRRRTNWGFPAISRLVRSAVQR
ncbi:hypothetical protein TRIP_B310029 [uncultured Desulfatiglans sp.]|uniref:Uncharacterized protein n=1 Tax=Uncultured Desulfatiglans sp. TaxID=1748965 RepID=A0A653A6X2_UNCDX|nr:hypothetical protein TRIP_B310029 [uncultured Desulfatiglans sp.]